MSLIWTLLPDVEWTQFGDPDQDTGYPASVLSYVWHKYKHATHMSDPADMYRVFSYIHL